HRRSEVSGDTHSHTHTHTHTVKRPGVRRHGDGAARQLLRERPGGGSRGVSGRRAARLDGAAPQARNWKDVTCRGSAELQLVYLLGFPAEQEKVHVVVPMPVHMTLSHARIRRIMESTCNQSEQQALFIILAIVDSDSTVVYYRLTDGFVVPDPPDVTEDMDNRKLRKRPKFHR
uniref:tRNA splicing endonuclease subunit 15 n=1 Tax=Callorhinchus milii TaxID=7868 RepID=A0A4W3K1D0_CALMI